MRGRDSCPACPDCQFWSVFGPVCAQIAHKVFDLGYPKLLEFKTLHDIVTNVPFCRRPVFSANSQTNLKVSALAETGVWANGPVIACEVLAYMSDS
jgi:hypothetical protein